MRRRFSGPWTSLRGRFLLVIVLGMALPIALLGPWFLSSARSSAETLLRARLDESLAQGANAVGTRWVEDRSALLAMAEDTALVVAVREGRRLTPDEEGSSTLRQRWSTLAGVAEEAVVRDRRGVVIASFGRVMPEQGSGAALAQSSVPVRLPVYERNSGERIGDLDARLRLSALLPAGLWWSGVGGAVLALFDENGGVPLLPLSMTPELFASDHFDWGDDRWIVVRRQLREPSLRLALAAPISPTVAPYSRVAERGAVALLVVLLAGVILSILVTHRITGPLDRLAIAADQIARGGFAQRVDERGPVELQRLGRAFNTMTESLNDTLRKLSQREAVAAVGEFAASLAHEVRNPLTSIRLDLERAGERLEDSARAGALLRRALLEIDRLDSTVSGSLRIARSGSLTLGEMDLRQPLQAAVHAAESAFAVRCARLEYVDASEPVCISGNAGALEQLFLNLLLNAAEALPQGGTACASLDTTPTGARVQVRDDGPGIPPELLERVCEPFFTTKEHGTGLGLAIAQRIAHAHGAELTLTTRPGLGTTASVTIPTLHEPAPVAS